MGIVSLRQEITSNKKYDKWSIQRGGNILAEGIMNDRAAKSLAYFEKKLPQLSHHGDSEIWEGKRVVKTKMMRFVDAGVEADGQKMGQREAALLEVLRNSQKSDSDFISLVQQLSEKANWRVSQGT
jgi:hypothetical protein